jgi:hypothetical protein
VRVNRGRRRSFGMSGRAGDHRTSLDMAGLSHAELAGSPINELARTAAEIALRTFSRPRSAGAAS